ncbi:hypothetical protein BC826DRAFT_865852, partial [Russula brevipes]
EAQIQGAISDLEKGHFKSRHAAVRAYNVPFQTLSDRISRRSRKKLAHQTQQLLNHEQENTLMDWIDYQATVTKPLDKSSLLSIASDLAGAVPGKNWSACFAKRNGAIQS